MILVTGAAGFVGRRVVQALADTGQSVRAMVRGPSGAAVLSGTSAETVMGDVRDRPALAEACRGVETVVHLAAVIQESPGSTFDAVNYVGTRNLIEAARDSGVIRFVHVSAIGVGSDPAYRYFYSRWMSEEEVKRSGIDHTILRSSVGFGEGDEFFNRLAALVKLSPIVPVFGDGRAAFQPVAVEDVARCVALSCRQGVLSGQTVEIAGPDRLTYDEMMDLVAETLGARIVKIHVPLAAARPFVAMMGKALSRPPITADQLSMISMDLTTDPDSVESGFGFAPIPLRGNIDYIRRIGLKDAMKINLGRMPSHIRDH